MIKKSVHKITLINAIDILSLEIFKKGFVLSLIKIKSELQHHQVCLRISQCGSNSITSQFLGLIPVSARMKLP